jgi:zinc transporter
VRRCIVEIGRHVGGLTAALRRFEQNLAQAAAQDRALRDWATGLAQRFDELTHDVRADAERARLLQEEANASGNWLANRQLFVLTVLNSLLLPATLVTGFFGMNTGGPLWGADDPNGTFKALVLCCAAAGAAALFMRRRGMFR